MSTSPYFFSNNEEADLFKEKWRTWTETHGLDGGYSLNRKWLNTVASRIDACVRADLPPGTVDVSAE